MTRIFRRAAALALAASVSACGSIVTGGPLIRPGEPQGAIRIINASGDPLNVILISDCSASTYGLNRLPGGMAIPRGGSHDFVVSAGCWDVAGGTIAVGDARGKLRVVPGGVSSLRIY